MRIPLFILAASLISLLSSLPCSSAEVSIYDVLRSHELPTGLFPNGITNFTLDPDTGRFEARLNQSCNAKFKSEETDVHYNWNVSGSIRRGEIADMAGMSAQDLFLWFPVKSIRVDFPSSGVVHFDVGVVRKQFSLSLFENPIDCTASEPDPIVITDLLAQKQVETIASEQGGSRGTDLWNAS